MSDNRNRVLCRWCHQVYDCSRQEEACPHQPIHRAQSHATGAGDPKAAAAPGTGDGAGPQPDSAWPGSDSSGSPQTSGTPAAG